MNPPVAKETLTSAIYYHILPHCRLTRQMNCRLQKQIPHEKCFRHAITFALLSFHPRVRQKDFIASGGV
jgi:hypothetical protein